MNTNAARFGKKALNGAVVGRVDPSALAIPKGMRLPRETTSEINIGIPGPSNSNSEGNESSSEGSSNPPSAGSQVSGDKNLLVIGVDFSNQQANYSASQVQPLFFFSC